MYFSAFYSDPCRPAVPRRHACAHPQALTHAAMTTSMEVRHAR